MNTTVGRAFVMSRLAEDQVRALHAREVGQGHCDPPYAIHQAFHTRAWGDVPEEKQGPIARVVTAVYEGVRREHEVRAKKYGEDYDEVEIHHQADWKIRQRGLDFEGVTGGAGSIRERLRGRRSYDAVTHEQLFGEGRQANG